MSEMVVATNGIGEWLSAWAKGEVQDQNTAFLDKIVRERTQRVKPERSKFDGKAAIHDFLNAYASGLDVDGDLRDRLDVIIFEQISKAMHTPGLKPDDSEALNALADECKLLQDKLERLTAECERAHDWRFQLEARCREVQATIRNLARVLKRAPTEEELEGMLAILREAIGWAP